ncbi:hypothetical protein UFOVP1518_6 [uncultured Caudovirales phage]|uniref:Uncharacterized protein n=1 Tax=uncultured Caudovirales phage TaxID=2100421 RepID=A0A6J5PJY2_9CAUD|nr:hypothetical protein UFOVP475_19 [uncultured Caudovirales phage]CAB4169545.1 hypothetical protein UFOVP897_49 [uncultured Caudovirales phage]CAB4175798.1 hypothetical protein UFOVP984_19 [uncultured Caudovirales phage]CAB4181673.1 hypothetical protein UFOVP1072_54 [uncultured Caudovirales phage]CAB4191300.1 hypothetical protein UFOVP1211_18 [uncultured Caudovirales phage]
MTTSNTYNYNPSLGELTLYAYNLVGIRNTSLLQEHMESARMATNLLLANWSNRGVNLWAVDLVETNLVTDQTTYDVDSDTVVILDAYVTNDQTGDNIDRIILPISRTEYASYPNKEQQGFPTVFWFDRLLNPTVTLWPVPNTNNGPTKLKYYRVKRLQDANFTSGQTLDLPYLWMEAFAYGLGQRLAIIWAPEKLAILKPLADEAYQVAAEQNIETAQQYISPQIIGYYRP